jgi:glycosyltransferase involved in cell wall biosynthesis
MLTSLGIGGAERQVIALAEHMAACGHGVSVIVLRARQDEEWPTHLEVVHLGMRRSPASILSALLCGRRFLQGFKPDLVHSHTFPANMTARVLRFFGATPAVLSTIHNVYEGGGRRMLAYRLTDRFSLRTTAVSAAAAQRYVALKAVPPHKCRVMTNAIDINAFAPDTGRRNRMRMDLAAGDDFIWLAAGRISRAKDYPNLIRAFARVHATCPRARLWIAGDGDPVNLGGLKSVAITEGMAESVLWLGLRRDMPALFDAADAFVLSSAWEGMPLVIGEAMAMEKPVVATNVGGVCEVVGDTGTMTPAKDSDALAEAMLDLMRRPPEKRMALGRAARQRIESQFSSAARFMEWEAFYKGLVARGT